MAGVVGGEDSRSQFVSSAAVTASRIRFSHYTSSLHVAKGSTACLLLFCNAVRFACVRYFPVIQGWLNDCFRAL